MYVGQSELWVNDVTLIAALHSNYSLMAARETLDKRQVAQEEATPSHVLLLPLKHDTRIYLSVAAASASAPSVGSGTSNKHPRHLRAISTKRSSGASADAIYSSAELGAYLSGTHC
jgi:hypothetical protein